jgi:hypothetical protein
MNGPTTDAVRSGPVRGGSALGRTPPRFDLDEPDPAPNPRLLDWVPATDPRVVPGGDYPIEGGVPHPRWVPESAEHRLASHPIVVAESAAVVRLLVVLAVAAFLLGLTVFYPVSPLGH